MANKSKDDQFWELKAKLKQAEKKAEYEALRARAFDTMINLAEEKFQHPHQKKIWYYTQLQFCPHHITRKLAITTAKQCERIGH